MYQKVWENEEVRERWGHMGPNTIPYTQLKIASKPSVKFPIVLSIYSALPSFIPNYQPTYTYAYKHNKFNIIKLI